MGLLDRQRRIIKQLVETPFQQGWQFRVECDGQPSDLDIYVKEITYGGTTIEYDTKVIGALAFTSPNNKTPPIITLTVRDHEDGRVLAFFQKKCDGVINKDGTVNLPAKYLIKLRLFRLMSDDSEKLDTEWEVSPASWGEITRDRTAPGEFVSFPMTFQTYHS